MHSNTESDDLRLRARVLRVLILHHPTFIRFRHKPRWRCSIDKLTATVICYASKAVQTAQSCVRIYVSGFRRANTLKAREVMARYILATLCFNFLFFFFFPFKENTGFREMKPGAHARLINMLRFHQQISSPPPPPPPSTSAFCRAPMYHGVHMHE